MVDAPPVIVGIDEVGTGALAGLVVVAGCAIADGAVVGVRDSKMVAEANRYRLATEIRAKAEWTALAERNIESINERGIRACWRECIADVASAARARFPEAHIIIDGQADQQLVQSRLGKREGWNLEFRVGADRMVYQVSAASLIAKTYRDRAMAALASAYPAYDFAKNKGYGSLQHRAALRQYGMCPLHREKFCRKILGRTDGIPHATDPSQEHLDLSPAQAQGLLERGEKVREHLDDWSLQFLSDLRGKLGLGSILTPRQNFFLRGVVHRAERQQQKVEAR